LGRDSEKTHDVAYAKCVILVSVIPAPKGNIMKLNIAIAFALVASFVSAKSLHDEQKAATVIFVIVTNPAFPSFVAPDLPTAQSESAAMSSLDPVCNAVPQVCETRAAMTRYTVVYSDGSTQVI
jgi:hypothetical protein